MRYNVEELEKDVILRIITNSQKYRDASYYLQHLYRYDMWRNFNLKSYSNPPYFLIDFCKEIEIYIEESRVRTSDIINWFNRDNRYFYVLQCILKHELGISDCYLYELTLVQGELEINAEISNKILSHAFSAFILDNYPYDCSNFEKIILEEQFEYQTNDYKLTKVPNVEFKQYGFVFDNKYYLYSKFIDKTPFENKEKIPAIFYLMTQQEDFSKADFYMRLDERLSIPILEYDNRVRSDYDKSYGPNFKFSETNLSNAKTLIVHRNNESGDQLLMVIKQDFDKNLNMIFWHVELEALPFYEDSCNGEKPITTFIHSKYYPNNRVFRHIDFIIKQYDINDYCLKQKSDNSTDIPIDFYAKKGCHFKIWCIENIDLSEKFWSQVSYFCLPENYRALLEEIVVEISQ